MVILRVGLIVGALAFLYVGWASWSAGYPPEVASVRAAVAFVAVTMVAYVGELIVATAPSDAQHAAQGADSAQQAAAARSAAPAAAPAGVEAAPAPAAVPTGIEAAPASVAGPALATGAQLASLPAGEPIVAPDFGASAAASAQEAEPAQLRPAA